MRNEIVLELKDVGSEAGCCPPLTGTGLARAEAEAAARLFAALADPTRLTILSLLARAGEGEVCVCDITGSFELGQPTISHHLRILREAGLIEGDKRGRWVYYRLVRSQTEAAGRMLQQVLGAAVPV